MWCTAPLYTVVDFMIPNVIDWHMDIFNYSFQYVRHSNLDLYVTVLFEKNVLCFNPCCKIRLCYSQPRTLDAFCFLFPLAYNSKHENCYKSYNKLKPSWHEYEVVVIDSYNVNTLVHTPLLTNHWERIGWNAIIPSSMIQHLSFKTPCKYLRCMEYYICICSHRHMRTISVKLNSSSMIYNKYKKYNTKFTDIYTWVFYKMTDTRIIDVFCQESHSLKLGIVMMCLAYHCISSTGTKWIFVTGGNCHWGWRPYKKIRRAQWSYSTPQQLQYVPLTLSSLFIEFSYTQVLVGSAYAFAVYTTDILKFTQFGYGDVMMSAMASQMPSLTIVYWTVYSGADQRKHQSSASLAFMSGDRWIPHTKGQ